MQYAFLVLAYFAVILILSLREDRRSRKVAAMKRQVTYRLALVRLNQI
jgi:hypothetical protein